MLTATHYLFTYLFMAASEECEFLIIWGKGRGVIGIQREKLERSVEGRRSADLGEKKRYWKGKRLKLFNQLQATISFHCVF